MQVARDAAAAVPPSDPISDGGNSPEEQQASFLELALCLAGGLPDSALDPLFAVGRRLGTWDSDTTILTAEPFALG